MMEFSRNYLVHYYEADSRKRLTLPSLVQYFEDIAILHSSARGYGLEYYDANNCGWMLLKWDIRIHSLPVFGETVKMSTRVHAMKRFLADREFVLFSEDGIILVEARSNWLLVDTVKRRPMRVPEDQYAKYCIAKERESDFITIEDVSSYVFSNPPAVPSVDQVFRTSIRTGNCDIDTNNHVNNVRHLSWALDSLPELFIQENVPVALRAQYKKELNHGDEAGIVSHISGPSSFHTITKGMDEICSMVIEWKKTDFFLPSH